MLRKAVAVSTDPSHPLYGEFEKKSAKMTSPYIHIKDKFGNDVFLGHGGDVMMPGYFSVTDFREHLRSIKTVELKPSDVIVAGFPKTGTHWGMAILHMLLHGTAQDNPYGVKLGRLDIKKQLPNPPDSPPRVLASHLKFRFFPEQVVEKGVKVVYMQRNPKDTWVSMYNHTHTSKGSLHYGGTWDHFFHLMMSFGYWYGDWFDHALDWEREIQTQTKVQIYTLVFEHLKQDPASEIEKLDQFLGLHRGRQLCAEIAEACSFQNLKAAEDGAYPKDLWQKIWQDNATGYYRKGEVGDWKNWFTVAQNEQFDEVYKKRMAHSKLRYTFEL